MRGDYCTAISVPIASLATHADQHLYNGTFAETDESALREDLRVNGQHHPIEILADGTIFDGHQRVRLLNHLGYTEVLAVVVDPEGDACERRAAFLRRNLCRRQLSGLQRGRLAVRLYEAEHGLAVGEAKDVRHWEKVKKIVHDAIEHSDRNAIRIARILILPDPVIAAVDQGRLKTVTAEKLDKLDEGTLNEVVAKIKVALESGTEKIEPIVTPYLPTRKPKPASLTKDLDAMCKSIESVMDKHESKVDHLTYPGYRTKFLDRLIRIHAFLGRLIDRLTGIDPGADPYAELFVEEPDDTNT